MEYNTKKNIEAIKNLMFLIESDAKSIKDTGILGEGLRLEATDEELECMWRTCELIESYADRARVLIGKMLDEREDMRNEAEEEDE